MLMVVSASIIVQTTKADVFASGLKISDPSVSDYALATNTWDGDFSDGSGVKIWFIINESGVGTLSATVTIKQGATTIKILTVPSPTKGVNSVVWDGTTEDFGNAPAGTYTFEILVSDPVGHSTFDSLWVAGAKYAGTDFDGGTSYAYRGVGTVAIQSSPQYGYVYVGRGTTSGTNGLYELLADGTYRRKIGTDPSWAASTPNEVHPIGGKIAALAGYGFSGGGYIRTFNPVTGTRTDSVGTRTTNGRGLFIRFEGTDTVYYYGKSGSGIHPQVTKIVGSAGDTVRHIDVAPYVTSGSGYVKAVAVDDDGNCYVAFGDASASRNKIAKFNSSGVQLWQKDASVDWSIAGAVVQAFGLYRGSNTTSASDDKLYALIYSSTASLWGIYAINLDGSGNTQLVSPNGASNAATSQIINVDPVGNVLWSNGSSQERIIAFSPANGPNASTTVSPTGAEIVVTTPLPVQLVALAVQATSTGALLTWKTASEVDNAGFEIERREIVDFRLSIAEYQKVGFVAGAGTSTSPREYSFADAPLPGRYAYRLKQVDRNGSITVHGEVEIEVGTAPRAISLGDNYPNPFNPTTTIEFSVEAEGPATLVVYDMTGRVVATLFDGVARAGFVNRLTFDARSLTSGAYMYRLTSAGKVMTKRMLLVK
jgi:hypothetical protein